MIDQQNLDQLDQCNYQLSKIEKKLSRSQMDGSEHKRFIAFLARQIEDACEENIRIPQKKFKIIAQYVFQKKNYKIKQCFHKYKGAISRFKTIKSIIQKYKSKVFSSQTEFEQYLINLQLWLAHKRTEQCSSQFLKNQNQLQKDTIIQVEDNYLNTKSNSNNNKIKTHDDKVQNHSQASQSQDFQIPHIIKIFDQSTKKQMNNYNKYLNTLNGQSQLSYLKLMESFKGSQLKRKQLIKARCQLELPQIMVQLNDIRRKCCQQKLKIQNENINVVTNICKFRSICQPSEVKNVRQQNTSLILYSQTEPLQKTVRIKLNRKKYAKYIKQMKSIKVSYNCFIKADISE